MKKFSKEHRQKLSKAHKGMKKPWVSKRNSKLNKKLYSGEKNPMWKGGSKITEYRKLLETATRPKPEYCEVCNSYNRVICFDHNHETGKFRGWICRECNSALGMAKDNPEILRKLADYLENN